MSRSPQTIRVIVGAPKATKTVPCFGALLLAAMGALAQPQTTVPGQQVMIARPAPHAVVVDGVLGAAEWSAAIPIHVTAVKPTTAPGVVPFLPELLPNLVPPDNQDDSSFTVRTLYDDQYLYVAVKVADDLLIAVHPWPYLWLDDDVEVLIDGDRQPWDFLAGVIEGASNKEGFQLITSVGGGQQTEPGNNPDLQGWSSAVAPAPRGFVVEVAIPLNMINTHDTSEWTGGTPGFAPPQPGDTIGFNIAVGDNDTGPGGYVVGGDQSDSFTAWDGSSPNWGIYFEQDWGSLYFAP